MVKALDGADAGLVPTAFVAVTVHVYVEPLVKEATAIGLPDPVADRVTPPFDDEHVASYCVMSLPPSSTGAVNETDAEVKVDASSPRIHLDRPLHHRYVRGAVVRAKYRCTDTGSGIARCHGSVASGDRINTGRLGVHHFTVRAKDKLGHKTLRTVIYRVVRQR